MPMLRSEYGWVRRWRDACGHCGLGLVHKVRLYNMDKYLSSRLFDYGYIG